MPFNQTNEQLRASNDAMAAYRRSQPSERKSINWDIETFGFVSIFSVARTGAVGNPDNVRLTGGKRARVVDKERWA